MRTQPDFGRAFYTIEWDGRTISRTFNRKDTAVKALRVLQGIQPYPLLDTRIKWLVEQTDKYGANAL